MLQLGIERTKCKYVICIAILFCCVISNRLKAQQYYISNLYYYNMLLMNPAAAGSDTKCYSFGLYHQQQWFGMDEAPTTQIIDYQLPLHSNLGIGGYIYNDRNGNYKQLGLHQALSYEILVHKNRRHVSSLAFGLALTIEQSSVDLSGGGDVATGVIDPSITGGVESGWGITASSGLLFKYDDWRLGFALTNLIPQNNSLYREELEPEQKMDINIHVSTLLKIPERDIFLEPILRYRLNSVMGKRLDASIKGLMPTPNPDYAIWCLLSYRRNMDKVYNEGIGLGTTLGVNYKKISFGLEYQLGLNDSQSDFGGAYQLVLKYAICDERTHRSIPCSKMKSRKGSRFNGIEW